MSEHRHVVYQDVEFVEESHYYSTQETLAIGEHVNEDAFILELEAAKHTMVIAAPVSGVLTRIFVDDEQPVKPGDPICEVMTVETDRQILDAARRILETRFPDDFEKLDEVLTRVDSDRISKSLLVLGSGSIDQIILELASDQSGE